MSNNEILPIFEWKHRGEMKASSKALNTRIEFLNGNEQVQQNAVNPIHTWECSYEGTMETMSSLKRFFDTYAPGGKSFYFKDENRNIKKVRFANDNFDMKLQMGFDETGRLLPQGGIVTLTFREVKR